MRWISWEDMCMWMNFQISGTTGQGKIEGDVLQGDKGSLTVENDMKMGKGR